ncbi:hypothetical protein FJ974_22690 [Mesorhizobium sp. B1-1-8]|nr:hypothetical protein FJ974_22690 [Mesorhizobium sp. B1-1-8]
MARLLAHAWSGFRDASRHGGQAPGENINSILTFFARAIPGQSKPGFPSGVVLHGSYHRGEVGRMLAQAGISPPWDSYAVHLHRAEPSRRLQMRREPLDAWR